MALGTGSRLPSGRSANFWAALAARSPGSGVSALLSVSLGLYEGSRNTKSVGDDAFATFGIAGGALIASSCLGAATGAAAAGFITSGATLFAAVFVSSGRWSFRTSLSPWAGSSSYLQACSRSITNRVFL